MKTESESESETIPFVVEEAEWQWLKPHHERDALIVVDPGFDLLTTGKAIAEDDSKQVQTWIQTKQIRKPEPAQIEQWEQHPTLRFKTLIVQPYVLIQEPFLH